MRLPHSNGGCWRSCDKRAASKEFAATIGCRDNDVETKMCGLQSARGERSCLSLSFKAMVVESLFM